MSTDKLKQLLSGIWQAESPEWRWERPEKTFERMYSIHKIQRQKHDNNVGQ